LVVNSTAKDYDEVGLKSGKFKRNLIKMKEERAKFLERY
jgi:hypothetical protein